MGRTLALCSLALLAALCAGCASVTQGTTHMVRIDTVTEAGEQIDGAECTLSNDQGTTLARSGASTPVRRSSRDLDVACTAQGQPKASARLVSRANVGLAGNIILGGGIGAVIDHNTGAAYTYPTWVRLVFGHSAVFDRGNEKEGTAMTSSDAPLVQGAVAAGSSAPTGTVSTAAATPLSGAVARGDTFDYRITDRSGNRIANVVLRAEHVERNEISFNNGARVEGTNGTVVRINTMLAGELDQVTPPGGWMPSGRVPTGSWKMKHRSLVPSSGMSYDLEASVVGEQKLVVQGRELKTVRVALSGWVESHAPPLPARARYEGMAWLSPELRRVVRYEARSRAPDNSNARFDIDETIELVRFGHD